MAIYTNYMLKTQKRKEGKKKTCILKTCYQNINNCIALRLSWSSCASDASKIFISMCDPCSFAMAFNFS